MLFWLQFEVGGERMLSHEDVILNVAMLPDTADVKAMVLGGSGPSGGSGHRRARAGAGSSSVGGQRTRSKGDSVFGLGRTSSRKGTAFKSRVVSVFCVLRVVY